MFDSLFNRALKAGVEKGVFAQPKGTCLCFLLSRLDLTFHRKLRRNQARKEGAKASCCEGCPKAQGREEDHRQEACCEEGHNHKEARRC